MKKLYLVLSVFLILFPFGNQGLCDNSIYSSVIALHARHPYIAFAYNNVSKDDIEVYKEYPVGVKIDHIIANECTIEPQKTEVFFSKQNLAKEVLKESKNYVYSGRLIDVSEKSCWGLITMVDGKGDQMLQYLIPKKAKNVKVIYRIRFPNNKLSDPHQVILIGQVPLSFFLPVVHEGNKG